MTNKHTLGLINEEIGQLIPADDVEAEYVAAAEWDVQVVSLLLKFLLLCLLLKHAEVPNSTI